MRTMGEDEAIQRAIFKTLTEWPGLISLFGGEPPPVWDFVRRNEEGEPEEGTTYLKIGEDQIIFSEKTEQVEEAEAYCDVHIWDQPGDGSGKELTKKIAFQTRQALAGVEGFEIFAANLREHGYICTIGECRDARHLEPADGLIEHAVLTFRFEVDPLPGF